MLCDILPRLWLLEMFDETHFQKNTAVFPRFLSSDLISICFHLKNCLELLLFIFMALKKPLLGVLQEKRTKRVFLID